ncbi:MAG: class I SAM-dependent methyltransferase [Anaerolineae bacterium]|nr:class I SAM-dependent methyltransferase [Anaerolineae bacterium]
MQNPFADLSIADVYDAWYVTPLGRAADQAEQAALLRLAQPSRGELALDVGCGTGHFSAMLAAAGAVVTGCDTSRAMLAHARRNHPDLRWHLADARELPYADASWDLVLSVTMLEFVREPTRALDEMWRVIKPGGRLVVAVLQAGTPWHASYVREADKGPSPFATAHFYQRDELLGQLARYGSPRCTTCVHMPPEGRSPRCLSFVEFWGRLTRPTQAAMLIGRVDK